MNYASSHWELMTVQVVPENFYEVYKYQQSLMLCVTQYFLTDFDSVLLV